MKRVRKIDYLLITTFVFAVILCQLCDRIYLGEKGYKAIWFIYQIKNPDNLPGLYHHSVQLPSFFILQLS